MLTISQRKSANAPAADRRDGTIGLLLEDAHLAARLRKSLATTAGLLEASPVEARLIVTDLPDAFAPGAIVLAVGANAVGDNAVASADPDLIVAAALLLSAGYRVEKLAAAPANPSTLPHLSPRERQVATLLADGASNKAIARTLGISVHTAKFHVTAILEKLGADNRADAVAILLREGLIAI